MRMPTAEQQQAGREAAHHSFTSNCSVFEPVTDRSPAAKIISATVDVRGVTEVPACVRLRIIAIDGGGSGMSLPSI